MKRLLKGSVAWFFISNTSIISSLSVVYFSASILTKEEFGLIGITMVFINLLESFKQLGFKEYLISKKKTTELEEDVAWTVELIKGLFLSFIIIIGAVVFKKYLVSVNVFYALLVMSLVFIFDSLVSPIYYKLKKEFRFKALFYQNFIANLIQAISTIYLLSVSVGFLSVIYGYVIRSLLLMILSYVFMGRSVKLKFDLKVFFKLVNYGGWILASGFLFFFTNRVDNLVVAASQDLVDLGLYTFAYSISNALIANPLKSVSNALFPILSRYGIVSYKNIISLLAIFIIVISIILIIIVPIFLSFIFLDKWEDSYYILQILIVAMALNAIKVDSFFMATGKTKDKFYIEIFRSILFITLLLPMVSYRGVSGAAEATLLTSLISLFLWFYIMEKNFANTKNIQEAS